MGTNQELATLEHPGEPRLAALSKAGGRLVTAGGRSIRIWNLGGTGEKQVLAGHLNAVAGLAFSSDGKMLASTSAASKVKVRDLAQGTTVRTLDLAGPVQALAFSPDGELLATGDWTGNLQIWQTASWQDQPVLDHGLGEFVWSCAFSPDGNRFAAGGAGGVAVWRLAKERPEAAAHFKPALQLLARPTKAFTRTLAFSPRNDLLAWVDHANHCPELHLWGVRRSQPLAFPPVEVAGSIHSLAFSPDGGRLMAVNPEHTTDVWDVDTLKKAFSFGSADPADTDNGEAPGSIVAASRDGNRLATQSARAVTVWDLKTRKLVLALPEGRATAWSLAWSPDGEQLAVGSSDGEVAIWHFRGIQALLAEIGL
jgi:WD40 repeat protein